MTEKAKRWVVAEPASGEWMRLHRGLLCPDEIVTIRRGDVDGESEKLSLKRAEARKLRDWLTEWLGDSDDA